ncbi:hypothetical protein niasHS_006297 [Heterodera schachtii]|uniref:BTB domain-containing protein n=1 Tax=Heterodera schachtii TaxID=97005 RepID=A0ABD2JSX0_HETSC
MESSKSHLTQPNTNTDQQNEKGNKYKRSGQILFQMPYFRSFANYHYYKNRFNAREEKLSPAEHINGLPWRISVINNSNQTMELYLKCDGDPNDLAWSCQASWNISIVPSTKRNESEMQKWTLNGSNVFDAINAKWGNEHFTNFDELMDPKNGLYTDEEDTMKFLAEVCTEKPRGMAGIRTEDILLVNGQMVYLNKYLLATHSDFFRTLFFGPNAEETPKIVIDGGEENDSTVANFERTISMLSPHNAKLDDYCVESVLLLANRFLLDSVENFCVNFLMNESKKSNICKFRLAHQCSIIGMKNKILNGMTKEDFDVGGYNHYDILSEHYKLDEEATKELKERHKQLFGRN